MTANVAVWAGVAVTATGILLSWIVGVIAHHKLTAFWIGLGLFVGGCTYLCGQLQQPSTQQPADTAVRDRR
ncbi:MAG TPA: hypothetical protein VHB79_24110 [Polyangiaceae bacterium]|nr:hypothetical protein [Polyangiaceae bacterium]